MSDKMRPIKFDELLNQVVQEYKQKGTLFYVPVIKINEKVSKVSVAGKSVESPIGPAAGPHTQLAQNIVAAYAAGARYFELKTVQVLEGDALGIQKPCIYVKDEAYNTEWSTELTCHEALEEYVKAWYVLKLVIKEFSLGDENGFVFNMSVGYNLEGIQSEKIDCFIENMKNAMTTSTFKHCKKYTLEHINQFTNVTREYVENIDATICNTITLSTMHGCPVEEIEKIATYLLKEKNLNVYIKCNPTLLGYEAVRKILDSMGYAYITFEKESFEKDLSFEAAVKLIEQLKLIADKNQKAFGVKLTNTFPVKITDNELVGKDMYMSGAALYPLAIGVAAKLSEAFKKDLMISYSGGADTNNIAAIYETGICPITVSTLLLKQGGYKNLTKLNRALENHPAVNKINDEKIKKLAAEAVLDRNYFKPEPKKTISTSLEYSSYCSKCKNCVDVCPNRANVLIENESEKYTVHIDALCNECGNCTHFCILGHRPYNEKFTVFQTEDDFYDSENSGVYKHSDKMLIRFNNKNFTDDLEQIKELPEQIKKLIGLL